MAKFTIVLFALISTSLLSSAQVTGSGTSGTIPVFTGNSSVGTSKLADNGTTLTYAGSGGMTIAGGNGNVLATGIVDGLVPVTVTTSTAVALGANYQGGYTFNNVSGGASPVIFTLPIAAAGKQYCISNMAGVTSPITLQTSGSGQFIDNGGTYTSSGGSVRSSGALGDVACIVGIDATHWKLFSRGGTWANITAPSEAQECNDFQNFTLGPSTCTLSGVHAGSTIAIGLIANVPITSVTANGKPLKLVDSVTNGASGLTVFDYVYQNAPAGVVTIVANMGAIGGARLSAAEFRGVAVSSLDGHGTGNCLTGCSTNYIDSAQFVATGADAIWSICGSYLGSSVSAGTMPSQAAQTPTPSWSSSSFLIQYQTTTAPGNTNGSCGVEPWRSDFILTMAIKR